jgi:pilus assembly protein CpaD
VEIIMKTELIASAARRSLLGLAFASTALLGGCMTDDAIIDDRYSYATAEERFPIRVAERPVKMNLSASAGTLRPDQMNGLINFAQDARLNSTSRVAVRWSSGSANSRQVAQEAIAVLIDQGVPESMIGVGSYQGSNAVVSLAFQRKVAVTEECGNWSDNLAGDQYNESYLNHGCATQHNIAAMVANPEDFERMRPIAPVRAASRSNAIALYDEGAAIPGSSTSSETTSIK